MRSLADLAQRDSPAVAIAAGVGGALALCTLYSLAKGSSKSESDKPGQRVRTLEAHSLLLGDLPEFARNAPRIHEWIAETSLRLHGEPWRIHVPGIKTLLVLTTPELVHDVLTTQFDTFAHGEAGNETMVDLFGRSIVTTDGETWHHQRKAAAKFFTARSLRTCMTTHMRKNMTQVYAVIDKAISRHDSIDMLKLFHEFALQTFAEVGLGIDLPLIGSEVEHTMESAIEVVTPVLLRREALPRFYWKFERWLSIGPERELADAMRSVREWLDAVVDKSLSAAASRQHKSPILSGVDDIKSVVELFLEQSSEDKEGLRAEDLKDFILTFVLGARGTSAMALVWIFLMLAKHPDVEKKIRDEMAVVLPDVMADDDAYITTDHTQKLVYLEATIKEVLRLYPTIPMTQREALQDTVIAGGIPVKKGDVVLLHPFSLARLPSVWGPDAADFKPDRWIDATTGELLTVPSSKFLTFSSGPRVCIGMKLAMLELRVVMANLLKRYEFSLAEPNDCSHVVSLELMLAHPLVMTATRTNRA